jgi:hypothetical protein
LAAVAQEASTQRDALEYSESWRRLFLVDRRDAAILTAPWEPGESFPTAWEVVADSGRIAALATHQRGAAPLGLRARPDWLGLSVPLGSLGTHWEIRPDPSVGASHPWRVEFHQPPIGSPTLVKVMAAPSVLGPIEIASGFAGFATLEGAGLREALALGSVDAGSPVALQLPSGTQLASGARYTLTVTAPDGQRSSAIVVPLWRCGRGAKGSGVEFLEPSLTPRWATLGSTTFGASCRYRVESESDPQNARQFLVLFAKFERARQLPLRGEAATLLRADRILVVENAESRVGAIGGVGGVLPLGLDHFAVGDLVAAQFLCWTPTRPGDGAAVSEIVAIEIRAPDGSARASSRTRETAERTWSRLGIVGEAEVADILGRVQSSLRR